MPTRRGAAAAAAQAAQAAKAALPLEDCKIALSGKFNAFGHNQSSLETVVRKLGGNVTKSVTKDTTHVACTKEDYNANSAKVVAGKSKDLLLVSPQWILDCETEGNKVDETTFAWAAQTQPGPNGVNGTTAGTKKRPAIATKDDNDDEPDTKKVKAGKAKSTKAKSATEDKASKEEKQVAEGQFIKKANVAIPLDEYCPLSTYQVYVESDSGLIWDASLNQSNSGRNNNKFYRIQVCPFFFNHLTFSSLLSLYPWQVLHEPKSGTYKTWARWGRVGEGGQNSTLGNGSLADATKNFEKKFRDKTGLSWGNRGDAPKPNKYAFVERSYDPDSGEDSDEDGVQATKNEDPDDDYEPPECTLEQPIQDLMGLIFNQQYFQATMSALNYDAKKMPLGKLSKATIMRGFQQLKDLAALMDDSSLASSKWNMPLGPAMEHLSNTYYSFIPHDFGRNRPPIISNDVMLKKEIELLESLSDMKDATDIMKIDRKSKSRETIHPLDRQFQTLGMEEMTTLKRNSNEFSMLANYLNESRGATHHMSYKVEQIFRIERKGEKQRFDQSPYASIKSDRRLLWHGSRCTNFGGILSQGLRIAPPEAPVSGYMFGKGIYLADMSSKSAGYCCSHNSGGYALLLLCEAELGDPMQKLTNASYTAGEEAKKKGMVSTWGQGETGPNKWTDAGSVHENLKGIKMVRYNPYPLFHCNGILC